MTTVYDSTIFEAGFTSGSSDPSDPYASVITCVPYVLRGVWSSMKSAGRYVGKSMVRAWVCIKRSCVCACTSKSARLLDKPTVVYTPR